MNNSVHRISLDIHDTASQVSISAKKGDTARSIYITLQENGKPYRIADGCYAVFSGVKPDGNYLFNDCTIKDNVIIYDFTEQTVPVMGRVKCEIVLYDANKERITSPRFDIVVEDVVYNNEEIVSSDEANALISATAEAKAITAEVEQKLANGDFVGAKGDPFTYEDFTEEQLAKLKGEKGDDADPQLFANAVKGYAEGESVRVDDVSPVEHTVNVRVDHTDPTSVKVTRCGKNLIPYPYVSKTNTTNGITFTDNGDGSVTINGAAIADAFFYLQKNVEYGDTINAIRLKESATNGIYTASKRLYYNPSNKQLTINILSGDIVTNETIYPQIELGTTATEYEPYKGTETYTPNADGTVDGITSLSPTMTLLTDTEGAVIHCEYNRDTNKVISAMQTAEGTIVSQNADFAEVAEWADGNPDNEDRTGYFVCANVPVDGIVMRKATSVDDVKGVSILAPAFAGNFTKDKLDSNGNLLPKYSYVAIIGFVPVRDNGTCEVGGRCMPDDNGCAVPSSNSMGYQVVNRIDENRVLIIVEPNGDMVQRVKTKINQLQNDVDNINEKTEWKTVLDTTLTEEQGGVTSLLLALNDAEAVANARRMRLHISFPQKEALAANKAWLSVTLQDETASTYALRLLGGYNVAASANTTLYSMASVEISDFGLTNAFKRSFVSVQQLPNPHYTASANSSANAKIITGGYKSDSMVGYPPYLNITIGNATAFNAGTKVFVEVQ